MKSLSVDPNDVRRAAGRLEEFANQLEESVDPPAPGAAWLLSSAAVSRVRDSADDVRSLLRKRMETTSRKLAIAGKLYAESDLTLAHTIKTTMDSQ